MARIEAIKERLSQLLPDGSVKSEEGDRTGSALTARVSSDLLLEAARAFKDAGFFLETMTGLDFTDTLEVVYHFNGYEPKSRVALRVLCGHEERLPSVTGVFHSAQWLEREVREFFGIPFDGNKDPRPLLLPEDADFHPHRKTFGVVNAYKKREEIYV